MTTTQRPGRGRPARIDQASTVDAALALLDDVGFDALTMRRLAARLGVQAGALYRHFATKQELLTAMAERMLAAIAEPPAAADWPEQLSELARALRRALLAHRDGAMVYGGTHSTGPHTLAFAESVVGTLRVAGFRDDHAARAFLTIVNFVLGHTLEEQAVIQENLEGAHGPGRLRSAVLAGDYPNLAATMPIITSTERDGHFEFALALLIEGLRPLVSARH